MKNRHAVTVRLGMEFHEISPQSLWPLYSSQLVMEKSPNAFQSFDSFVGVENIVPFAALELQNMPGVVCIGIIGREVTFSESQDLQIPLVDSKMQYGDVVIDRRHHINLATRDVS